MAQAGSRIGRAPTTATTHLRCPHPRYAGSAYPRRGGFRPPPLRSRGGLRRGALVVPADHPAHRCPNDSAGHRYHAGRGFKHRHRSANPNSRGCSPKASQIRQTRSSPSTHPKTEPPGDPGSMTDQKKRRREAGVFYCRKSSQPRGISLPTCPVRPCRWPWRARRRWPAPWRSCRSGPSTTAAAPPTAWRGHRRTTAATAGCRCG